MPENAPPTLALTPRQQSEIDFHVEYAARHQDLTRIPVDMEICHSRNRRWWNAHWRLYDRILELPLRGLRVLVPGCGFGEDCIRIASLGAEVFGSDISPEIVEIASQRAAHLKARAHFDVMPFETTTYPDSFFDAVVLVNILHHVDVPAALAEVRRVAKRGAHIVGLEMYTHSSVQGLRESNFARRIIYPRLVRSIYGGDDPYITPDERKLDENELSKIVSGLENVQMDFFYILAGRLFPEYSWRLCQVDRALSWILRPLLPLLAGRVIFSATTP